MNQSERRRYLIGRLLDEQKNSLNVSIPSDTSEQRKLLRSLMNIRMAGAVDEEFQRIQDEYLQQINMDKGIVGIDDMAEVQPDIYIWRGDITRLRVGAIVNAANSGLTGCYQPCHSCIDNCIHTYAGVQLRNYCKAVP